MDQREGRPSVQDLLACGQYVGRDPMPVLAGIRRTRLLGAVTVSRTDAYPDQGADQGGSGWVRMAVVTPITTKIYWVLRIGVAAEFIGHGFAGLTRGPWLPYYALFGFEPDFAWNYMFYVTGTIDVIAGLLILFFPIRLVLLYTAVWGTFTAFLRPAAGESWYEVWERGGNAAMPIALLMLVGWGGWSVRQWLTLAKPPAAIDDRLATTLDWTMRLGLGLLLIGHGGFGVAVRKAEWYDFFAYLGFPPWAVDSAHLMAVFGWFEIVLGLAVLVRPGRGLLVFVLFWKVGTELLRPLVGQELFQFVERAGDYALPIALYLLVFPRARGEAQPGGPPDALRPTPALTVETVGAKPGQNVEKA